MIESARTRTPANDRFPSRKWSHRIAVAVGRILAITLFAAACVSTETLANERVQGTIDGVPVDVTGRIVVEAQDGGLLLESPDGRQWAFEASDITSRQDDGQEFRPMDGEELGNAMLERLGGEFRIHRTQHYVIAYETSEAFAIWTGALFERLLRGFESYWSQRDIELRETEFPLPVVIFGSQARFREHATEIFGGDPGSIIAFYHLLHNEVVLYDVTEADRNGGGNRRRSNSDQINALLAQPAAAALVATIVHEATHQVAYNVGLQRRLADVPMWVNEGIATFFETPDLRSRSGWRGVGLSNALRLPLLKQELTRREAGGLERLLTGDARFRDGETLLAAYSEAWGLVWYLAKVRKDDFAAYLRDLQQLAPLGQETDASRLEVFRRHFGDDLDALDRDFVRYIERQR